MQEQFHFQERVAVECERRRKESSEGLELPSFRSRRLCLVFEADERSLIVLVDWVGFEVDERTWEPFREIFEAAPEFLAKELRKLRVTRAVAARIKHQFGIQL